MEEFRDLLSVQEKGARAKATFHAQFQRTRAFQLLNPIRAYDPGRLDRLEDACWRFRCAATRQELKGARARRARLLLMRLKRELGEPGWLSEQIPAALDMLRNELQGLATKRPPGRPRDSLGKTFRRNMRIFFSPVVVLKTGCRPISRTELDEILNELFKVAIGRALSIDSYVRMRKREQAAESREFSALHRQRPPRVRDGRQLHRRTTP